MGALSVCHFYVLYVKIITCHLCSIYCQNNDFVNKAQGGCSCGIDLVDPANNCADGNGHGTHVAGTVGGMTWGVAKEAQLIAIRVLNDDGSGNTGDLIDGLNWAVQSMETRKRPSVANLSVGASYSESVNNAVSSAFSAGLNVVVSAGNDVRPVIPVLSFVTSYLFAYMIECKCL